MELVEAIGGEGGVVCVVSAAGKRTTLYALANRVDRAAVTATVPIPIFDPKRERADRYRGYEPETITRLGETDSADAVLVKADDAKPPAQGTE